MILIQKDLQVSWPVTVSVAADGGVVTEHVTTMILRALNKKSRNKMHQTLDESRALTIRSSAQAKQKIEDVLDQICVDNVLGWDDVQDADGKKISFSEKNLLAAMDAMPALRDAIVQSLADITLGKPAASTSDNI